MALAPLPASAFPFLPLRPGGTPFEGPVDWEPSALWWNPAALGPARGVHVQLVAQARLDRGEIDRAAIRSDTGLPRAAADRTFAAEPYERNDLGGFGAFTVNLSENITFAGGVYSPWQSCSIPSLCSGTPSTTRLARGSLDLPSAYHVASESWAHVYFAGAAAIRISPRFFLGAGLAVVDSFATIDFYRDTALDGGNASVARPSALCGGRPCGYEDPAAMQGIHAQGDGQLLPTGLAASVGVVARPTERFWIGASWQRVFPAFSSQPGYSTADALHARVSPAPGATGDAACGGSVCTGGDVITYALPDVWHVGAKIALRDNLELSTWGRLVVYGGYGSSDPAQRGLVVRLSGDPVRRGGAPSMIVFDYGLQPAVAAEVGLRWTPHPRLRLGISTAVESSAVAADRVSAAALDAPKLDTMLAAEVRATSWLRLALSYGLTTLFPATATAPPSGHAYDPGATVRCVDARYDVASCTDATEGRGLPTNAGDYSLFRHSLALSATADF